MFTTTFYINSSDKNVMYKEIIPVFRDVEFTPTNTINIFNPLITVDYNAEYLTANYIYIPLFSRYYYIRNISIQTGKKMLIECDVDPLMSFSDDIKTAFVNVCRAENPANRDLADDKIQINPKTYFIETNPFPNNPYTYGGNQYVIGVNGTEVTTP